MKLTDKAAIVTGAGRGLGRAIALGFARQGARVTLVSRDRPALEDLSREIKRLGSDCLVVSGDVVDEETVREAVDRTAATFGAVDVLVNNAATIGPPRFVDEVPEEAWRRALQVNLHAPILFCRLVTPLMRAGKGGKIINIVSGLGQMPFPRFCAYSVSKAGLIQLTRSLSAELAPHNIQVNAIDPGMMDTAMGEEIRRMGPGELGEELDEQFRHMKELGRLKTPEKVVPLVIFLAAAESDFLSGEVGTLDHYREMGWGG